jgi:CRP-like cAMP-binding protein
VILDKLNVSDFIGGWFVGDFEPSLFKNQHLEAGVKFFSRGDTESSHKQLLATEITVVSSGRVRIGSQILESGDVLIIYPGEFADFEALTDGSLTCVKFPSIPSDKVLK